MVAVDWVEGRVRFIDQTLLPAEECVRETDDYRVVEEAIRSLRIRGAPAIGVAAAFGVCLSLRDPRIASPGAMRSAFETAFHSLLLTRPTAVNLFAALARVRGALERALPGGMQRTKEETLAEARAIQREDVEACRRIGELGTALLSPGARVLTHCNSGALATAGTGTALGVIVAAAAAGRVSLVYVDETRPLLQGARLTAWELQKAGIDHVLITDSTAGMLFRGGKVDAVLVGADRIAANGDAANKIGTYSLAVLARHHHLPFYVAAPTSTIDPAAPTGDSIPIEERDSREVTHIMGTRIAPEGVRVYAPAFDVTPHDLIDAIITERGILRPPYETGIAALRGTPRAGLPGDR